MTQRLLCLSFAALAWLGLVAGCTDCGGAPPGGDDGGAPVDARDPGDDAGGPGDDAGGPDDDAGGPDDDAGGPGDDAGAPGDDAGVLDTDGGADMDAGAVVDAGSVDAGVDGGVDGGGVEAGGDAGTGGAPDAGFDAGVVSGGTGGGPITGALHVRVIDDDTRAPIVGALVRIGDPAMDGGAQELATDAFGVVDFTGLAGPQLVTVHGAGLVTTSWIGVDAADLTIPVSDGATPAAATGTISGSIDLASIGVDPGHYLVAFVETSTLRTIDDASAAIPEPADFDCTSFSACTFDVTSRAGTLAVYATIVELDANGTFPPDDDVVVGVVAYALARGVVVPAGGSVTGVALEVLTGADLDTMQVVFPASTPPGLTTIAALPLVDLGAEGLMVLAAALTPAASAVAAPLLQGALAGTHYIVAAVADDPNTDARATTIARGAVALDQPVALDPWMVPPASLAVVGSTLSFEAVTDAVLYSGEIESQGNLVWSLTIFDGRTSVTLPVLGPDPIPAGAARMEITAVDAPVDPNAIVVDALFDLLDRAATDAVDFVH